MSLFFKRPWYLTSIALVLTAIAVEFAAKGAANTGMTTMAKAVEALHEGAAPGLVESMHEQGYAAAHRSDAVSLIGLLLAAGAAGCFCVSIQTRESLRDLIPLGLGLVYIAWVLVRI